MGGGRDTSEYRTIFACAIDLRLAIHRLAIHRHNLTQLEDKLSSRNIISKSELSSSISKGESAAYESSWKEPPELARAASLVWLIQNKVEQDAKTFHTFIGFLEEDKKRYSIILPKLQQTYAQFQQGHETKNVPSRLPGFIVRHMGEDVLKSLVCDDDDCRGRRIRCGLGWIITRCAWYFERWSHPKELHYFGRCLGLNVDEIMEIMHAVPDVETQVRLMIYQWSSKDKLRGEGTVQSFMEVLFDGGERDLLMYIVQEFGRPAMTVSQESYDPAAATGHDILKETEEGKSQGHETKNVPSRLPGFIVRHMGEDVLKSLVCDDDDYRGRRIRRWIITGCARYFEHQGLHPMELRYFGRCLDVNVDEIMAIMYPVPDVETRVRLMIYQWSSKDKLRGEGTVRSFMEALFNGGEMDLLMHIVHEYRRRAMMMSQESYDPAVATGHDILKEIEEEKSQELTSQATTKIDVSQESYDPAAATRPHMVGSSTMVTEDMEKLLLTDIGEMQTEMLDFKPQDAERRPEVMEGQWGRIEDLANIQAVLEEGVVTPSSFESESGPFLKPVQVSSSEHVKLRLPRLSSDEDIVKPVSDTEPHGKYHAVVAGHLLHDKIIEDLEKLHLSDKEGERQTRETRKTRQTGVLKEVDGSHFHVFGIPENSTNLSHLRRRVMPTYVPTSGYGYHQYVEGESVHPNEQILLLDQDDRLFQGYEARQLMKDEQEIKLADAKWKCVFVQFKSKSSVTPGLLFLYYNPHSACSPDTLSEEESSKLIECYCYLLSTPNIVSLSYEEDDDGKDVLSVGVIKSNSTTDLPKIIIYETPQKWMKIPMQIYQEGVIKALSGPCEGGCKIYTEGINNCGGTLGMIKKAEDGQIYLYSCAHVLTVHDDGNKQKKVYIEGDADPIAVVEDHIPVRVYDRNDIVDPERFTQDLAWAKFNTTRRWSSAVKDIGAIKGIRSPMRNEMVKYYGAVSLGVQDAIKIKGTNAATKVKVEGCGWVFYKQIIKLDTRHTFIEEGDSGSAMVAHSDTKVVGILMSAGEEKYSPKASVQVGDSGSAVVAHSDTKVNGILMSADEEENSPKGSLHAYACKL